MTAASIAAATTRLAGSDVSDNFFFGEGMVKQGVHQVTYYDQRTLNIIILNNNIVDSSAIISPYVADRDEASRTQDTGVYHHHVQAV
jgi:hypothetical protein